MLGYYDLEGDPIVDPLRSFHTSGVQNTWEYCFLIKNDDPSKYYVDLMIQLILKRYEDVGEYGSTGWSVKFIPGVRQPTEVEWAAISPGEAVPLGDVGTVDAGDTSTSIPVWVRVSAPFNAPAQIRDNQVIRLYYLEKNVI